MKPPVPDPLRDALFLDFDGTLVGIAPRPDAIVVPPALPRLITRLRETFGGAFAILSGRRIADLEKHLGIGGFAAAGIHGLERHQERRRIEAPRVASLSSVRQRLKRFADARNLILEDKGSALALHVRERPEFSEEVQQVMRQTAQAAGLALVEGKAVFELKPVGITKGTALSAFMAEAPFAGRRPVAVGDDTTDEDAFAAALGAGGAGVKVGTGEQPTAARFRLEGPDDVLAWLEKALP